MTMDPIIASIIIGIIAAGPGMYAIYRQRQKDLHTQPQDDLTASIQASRNAADAVNTYATELRKLREDYQILSAKFDALQDELSEKNRMIEDWQNGIERLIGQITSLGYAPVWKPKTK